MECFRDFFVDYYFYLFCHIEFTYFVDSYNINKFNVIKNYLKSEKEFAIPELPLIILSYAWEPKKNKKKLWFKKCRFNKINSIKCFLKCFGLILCT